MVDSLTKKGTECARKNETETSALRKVNSKLGNGADTVEGKRTKLLQEEGSPWVIPRSDCKNSLFSEGDSKLKGRDKTSSKLDKLKAPPPDKTIRISSHNASVMSSKGRGEKRPDGQKKNAEVNQTTDATGKNFSTMKQGVTTADKELAGGKIGCTGNQQSENLRMKLCELMGSVFSPEKGQTGSPAMHVGASLQPRPNINQSADMNLQPKPNSDTIETDSENLGGSKRRPVSRSITRKRAQKKAPLKKVERGHHGTRKDMLKEGNVYLFGEGCKVTESCAGKKSSSIFQQKKRAKKQTNNNSKETGRKFTWDEPHRISFPLEENEDKVQEEAGRKESRLSAGRSSSRGVSPQDSSNLTPHKLGKNVRPGAVVTEKDPFEQLLERNLDGAKDINIAKLAENVVCGKHTGSALKKSAEQQTYSVSPTLGRRTPLTSSSPDSSCKDDRTKQGNPSVAGTVFNLERMFTFENFTTKDIHTKPREQPDVGNDDMDSPDSAASDSDSSEGDDLDSSEKDSLDEETSSPEVATAKNSNTNLHRPKRPRSLRDIKSYDHQLVSHPSKGKGIKSTARKQDSGEFQVQDEFSRAIGPLAMSLEKIKSKMKSVTAKKSSEILNSLAAKIQVQMQNTESQVLSDMGKVKNFSKQKRKFLEREFQEQEKQLKSIHERFKKELSQHLQHCLETTEGLEENEIELKKILEKQKASHRKLLKQVEAAAQTEIQDAEKRISNMNKLAREQMLQLRRSIEQSLGEDVLC